MLPIPAAEFLAAVPFLPHGKGALILILGGLAILPAALLLSRASPASLRWTAGLEQGAAGLGLGPCRLVHADLRSCVVLLSACPSCRGRPGQHGPCVREQQGLRSAAMLRAPGARVTEVSCNPGGRGTCTFVVYRGG